MKNHVREEFQRIIREHITNGQGLEAGVAKAYDFLLKPAAKADEDQMQKDIDIVTECVETDDQDREEPGDVSYTESFFRILAERKHMIDNLSQTQARCTELINRAREQTPDHVKAAAEAVLAGTTRSYVEDATLMARWVLKFEKE